MTAPTCGSCDNRAVWRWVPKNAPPSWVIPLLCDDHAAVIDLDELEELGALP